MQRQMDKVGLPSGMERTYAWKVAARIPVHATNGVGVAAAFRLQYGLRSAIKERRPL